MLVPRLIAAGLMLLPISATAGQPHLEQCHAGKKWGSNVTCVVDGDTIWLSGRKLRLKGFDTPETNTHVCGGLREVELGKRARDRLVELLNASDWTVEYRGEESNEPKARELVTIRIAGRDVGQILTDEHLARKWPNGPEWWCP